MEQYVINELSAVKTEIKNLASELHKFSEKLVELTTTKQVEKTADRLQALESRVSTIEKFNVKLIAIWGTIQVISAGAGVLVGWWLRQ